MKIANSHLQLRIALLMASVVIFGSCRSELVVAPNLSTPPQATTSAPDLHFFTFGDWGTGTDNQKSVATAVGQHCAAEACDFGFLLGDNFYDSGVDSVTDSQWQDKFEAIYDDPVLQVPFYAVLGNHDHDGDAQAEIDYTSLQGRWKMPAAQYTVQYPADATLPLVEFFAADSVYGDAMAPEIVEDLRQSLENSAARWRVLILHHPLYSNGDHGDTSALRDQLVPLICNRVDVVLSGHDHLFAHLTNPDGSDDGCSFHQFVVGTGGRGLYEIHPHTGAVFSDASLGFAVVHVTPEEWTLDFIRSDNSHAYHFPIRKP